MDISGLCEGIEFYAHDLANIEKIILLQEGQPRCMTIENKTAYYRYNKLGTVTVFISGYANRFVRDFLKLIKRDNPTTDFYHFGDIDAGGFYIHRNLCQITGIDFKLFSMSIGELQNPAYATCLHALTEVDRTRLEMLKENITYREVVEYMLVQGVKLEQEIVSLALMKV